MAITKHHTTTQLGALWIRPVFFRHFLLQAIKLNSPILPLEKGRRALSNDTRKVWGAGQRESAAIDLRFSQLLFHFDYSKIKVQART
jgi:hypothetical protein